MITYDPSIQDVGKLCGIAQLLPQDMRQMRTSWVQRTQQDAKGFTQEELADRAGLSTRHLGDIERAKHAASVSALGRLAAALRVDPCSLICRDRSTHPPANPAKPLEVIAKPTRRVAR